MSSCREASGLGVVASGQPGCGLSPVDNRGVEAVAMSDTSSFAGLLGLRAADAARWCPLVAFVMCDSCEIIDDAFRAACFCWATAMGDRISLMCLSMKTGFFFESFNLWKRSSGFSS
jgi:hypothetical protein